MKKADILRINAWKPLKKAAVVLVCISFFFAGIFSPVLVHGTEKPQSGQKFQQTKSPEIQQIKPKKPVKIKLKRGAKGEYSWDLSGDSVDDVVRADKRLRKLLEME